MLERIGNGFSILWKAIIFFFQNPKTIIPIILSWLLITPIILYIQYNFSFVGLTITEVLLLAFIIIFGVTFVTSLASLILLELLEQHETVGTMSLGKAFKDAFTIDLLRALPLIFGWSIIQFLLFILEVIIEAGKNSDKKRRKRSSSFSFEDSVRSGGSGNKGIDFIKKGLRMGVMLMFAGIAWEELSSGEAYRKGVKLYKTNMATMLTGVGVGFLMQILIMLPVGIMVSLADQGMQFTETAWMVAFFYGGFAWSLNLFVEQMFAAEVYLWNRSYEIELEKAKSKGEKLPTLKSTKKPSFIDNIQSLKVYKNLVNEVDDPFEKYDKVAY